MLSDEGSDPDGECWWAQERMTHADALAAHRVEAAHEHSGYHRCQLLPSTHAKLAKPPAAPDRDLEADADAATRACRCAAALEYARLRCESHVLAMALADAQHAHDTARAGDRTDAQLHALVHSEQTSEAQCQAACVELMSRCEARGTKRKDACIDSFYRLWNMPFVERCRYLVDETLRAHNNGRLFVTKYALRYAKERTCTALVLPPAPTRSRTKRSRHDADLAVLEAEKDREEDHAVVLRVLNERAVDELCFLFEHESTWQLMATDVPESVAPDTRVAEALALTYLTRPTQERAMLKRLKTMARLRASPLLTPRVVGAAIRAVVEHALAPSEVRNLALALLANGDARLILKHPDRSQLYAAAKHLRGKSAVHQLEQIIVNLEHPSLKDWVAERDAAMATDV